MLAVISPLVLATIGLWLVLPTFRGLGIAVRSASVFVGSSRCLLAALVGGCGN